MATTQNQPSAPSRLGTVNDAARILSLPRSTVYGLIRDGRFPGVLRIGKRIRIDLDRLDQWIDENTSD